MPAKQPFRIVVASMSSHGHLNACHGLVEELRDRGHEIIFLLDKAYCGRLVKFGFKEYMLEPPTTDNPEYDPNAEFWPQFMDKNSEGFSKSAFEQLGDAWLNLIEMVWEAQKKQAPQYAKAIAELKPQLLVSDAYVVMSPVVNSGIPYIWMYSASANGILDDHRIPPAFSGLPENAEKQWKEFRAEVDRVIGPLQVKVNRHHLAEGGKDLNGKLHPYSDFLNLYMQPEELRFKVLDDLPDNIVGVDCFVRTVPTEKFDLPEQLKNKPGKLIFFSLGSFCSANRTLMTRILAILAKSPNRFIVSMGQVIKELPGDNMAGFSFLPQTAVLPMVDLVITHGGNNTVTETFFYGKRMLVMPVFGDQFDNATRITETGLGESVNPWTCSEEELLGKIEKLLSDQKLAKRMEQIGQRIRASTDKQKVANLIESKLAALL